MEKLKEKSKIIIIITIVAVVAIVAVVMMLTKGNSIELTSENYKDYLSVSTYIAKASDAKEYLYRDKGELYTTSTEAYNKILISGSVKAKSDNFNYEDVEVQIHYYGDVMLYNNNWESTKTLSLKPSGEKQHIDKIVTISCDIAGNTKEQSGNGVIEIEQQVNGENKENYVYLKDLKDKEILKVDIKVKGKVRPVGR